jgi:protein PhnA
MKLKKTPELHQFLSTYLADADAEADEQVARSFAEKVPADKLQQLINQIKAVKADPELPIDEFGSEANRWFGDADEAGAWLGKLLGALASVSGNAQGAGTVVVKDSNGTVLAEGDSVHVIKDLKVKGGSSDLKRGTLIKKIHLIDDAEAIECRVDGSTLVLKTCFLKKA